MARLRLVKVLACISLLTIFSVLADFVIASGTSQAAATLVPKTKVSPTPQKSVFSTPSTSVTSPVPTSITLTATPTQVRLQSKSTLSGVLSSTDTATSPPGPTVPLANEPVQIQENTGSGTWTDVANVITDTTGAYTASVTITHATAQFRAVFGGDTAHATSQSGTISISGFLAATKFFSVGPAQLNAETTTTFTVHYEVFDSRVSGRAPIVGAYVDVYAQDVYGGRWFKLTTVVTNAAGNLSWRAKESTPTNWELRGYPTATSLGAQSGVYRPRLIPINPVYRLPSSAPKPQYIAPQPAAIGSGAHPVVSRLSDSVWNFMVGKSWHSGCPVGRYQLEYMTINYWGFDGYRHRGEMVFNKAHDGEFIAAFTRLYNHRIPLHGMYLVDRYGYSSVTHGGNDYASMEHDNTSAFNCRWVDGRPGVLSPHAYGTAVDINPYENPFDSARGWTPNSWWHSHFINPYTWRSGSSTVVSQMSAAGFNWTYGNADSQHFDAR